MANSLESVLKAYVGQFHFGEGGDGTEPPFDRDRLIDDLRRVTRFNEKYFQIAIGMALIVFLFGCGLVLFYRTDPTRMAAIFSASGISSIAAGGVGIFRFWKQKVMTDTFLVLVGHMSGKEMKGAVKIMFDAIRK